MNNIKQLVCILFCNIVLLSCTTYNPETFRSYIDGYWQIDKVILADGTEKAYTFNQTIDFFEINDTTGVRKKLQPKLDGSFLTSSDSEMFTLKIDNDSLRMNYSTALSSWTETVVSAKEDQIVIKNEAGNLYFYKPFKKISL
ncbi:lipocalin family protein [Aquimarina sp. U1-2]|uniref:lipocalin family protein n=1 Tax=Aquimarina sp. U1-2 TaxID=2823141 RepID=UPI001AEC93E4|nr:lipocalin family protein [Aquimarina sp. U1-2]